MKQEKEKKGLPFFGIPKLAPYLTVSYTHLTLPTNSLV